MKKFLVLVIIIVSLFLVPTASAFRPNMTLNITDTPDPVVNGTSLNLTINLTNRNNGTLGNNATNITFVFTQPINTTFFSSSIPANNTDGFNLTYIIFILDNRTSFTFSINLSVNANATGSLVGVGNITNYTNATDAAVVFTTPSSNFTVNTAVTVETKRPNITISKTNTSGFTNNLPNGTSVNFSINVTNVGNMTAYNVTIVDNATDLINSAGNLTFSSASIVANDTTNTTWVIYAIEAGASFTFSINFTISTSAAGTLNNTVNVTNYTDGGFGNLNPGGIAVFTNSAVNGSNSTATATVSVETRRPNVSITKTILTEVFISDSTSVNYTINVSNIGNSTAFNVTVIENYTNQAFLTFVGASIVANDTTNSTWVIFAIPPDSSFIFTINLSIGVMPDFFVNFVNVSNYTDNITDSNLNPGSTTIFSADGNVTNASVITGKFVNPNSPSSSGTGGSSSGSGPGGVIKIHAIGAVGADATALTIFKADTTYLRTMDLDFLIAVTRITRDGATFSIGGVPLVLDIGQTEEIDLNGDGWLDLSVTLTNSLFNRIMITTQMLATPVISPAPTLAPVIRAIPEEISPDDDSAPDAPGDESAPSEEQIVESPPRSNKRLITAVLIAVVLLGVIGYGLLNGPLKPWLKDFSKKKKTMVWTRKIRK